MKSVLIIDDSPFIVKEVGQIAEENGYRIAGRAKCGEDGILKYKETKPDVVTLDIVMPGMDGIETARQILEYNPQAKIVMLSSLCDFDTMEEISEIGLKELVSKPIQASELVAALKRTLNDE